MIKLPNVLPAPNRPQHLDENVKWLSGEGAGSWFLIEILEQNLKFRISRYSPSGKLECGGVFISDIKISLLHDYHITYPSHCQKVTIIQDLDKITFTTIS